MKDKLKCLLSSFFALIQESGWPILVILLYLLLLLSSTISKAHASEMHYSGRLSARDYLYGSREQHSDPIFDNFKPIDLSVNVGVGSDCGKINFQSTLQSSLQNMLDLKYFAKIGGDILGGTLGGAWMLTICYMSPTWCAILKHSQLNANFLSQMRLDQCSLIDKYVDSRVDDFYRERQDCVHKAIESNGGNMDSAMEACRGNNIWETDLANWAGPRNGEKASANRLIDSSAKWAGLNDSESKGTVDLIKSLVGDTVVSRGSVSVEYGPRRTPMIPRIYLESLEKSTYDKLCTKIMKRVDDAGNRVPVDQIVSDSELQDLSNHSEQLLVDRQTIRALSYMNPNQRDRACKKLSDAAAMTLFSNDLNRSLDVLTTLSQNPNLPPERKQEIQEKRKALKEQIELTVELQKERSEPLNQVLSQIHEEGSRLQSESVAEDLGASANSEVNHRTDTNYMDCSDGVMCNQ